MKTLQPPWPRRSVSRAFACTKRSAPSSASSQPRTACAWSSSRTACATASRPRSSSSPSVGPRAPTGSISAAPASTPHVFAAGDVTGRLMLVPQALQDGFIAATNAVLSTATTIGDVVTPVGSFTDPEYAQVGLTEARARAAHDVLVVTVRLDETARTTIDGRTFGFCKLVVDRRARTILGCHVVGERAVDIVQNAAIAMAGGMTVDALARIPFSFPTHSGILGRAAAIAARQLNVDAARNELAVTI